MSLGVGDSVWIFDENRRVYRDEDGNYSSRCIFRQHFCKVKVTGETRQSWILSYQNNIKVNKKTLKYKRGYGRDGNLYLTEDDIDKMCWIKDNKMNIIDIVRRCDNYKKLKQVEDIMILTTNKV